MMTKATTMKENPKDLLGIKKVQLGLLPAAGKIYGALAYYWDHQEEIDQRVREDDAWVEEFMRKNPSRLQQMMAEAHAKNVTVPPR